MSFLVSIIWGSSFVSRYVVNLKTVNPWYPRLVTTFVSFLPLRIYPYYPCLPLHRMKIFAIPMWLCRTCHVCIRKLSRVIDMDRGFLVCAYVCLMVSVKLSLPKDYVGLRDSKPWFRSSAMLIDLTLWPVYTTKTFIPFWFNTLSSLLISRIIAIRGCRSSRFGISFVNLTRVYIVKLIMLFRFILGMDFMMMNDIMLWFNLPSTVNWIRIAMNY